MKQVTDISDNRIDKILTELSQTPILQLPGSDEQTPELFDLLRLAKDQIETAANSMNTLTITVLKSSVDMLNILLVDYDKFVADNNLSDIINEEVQLRYAHMESQEQNGCHLT